MLFTLGRFCSNAITGWMKVPLSWINAITAPMVIRPFSSKNAARKITANWVSAASICDRVWLAANRRSAAYFASAAASFSRSKLFPAAFFIPYARITSYPENRSFSFAVNTAICREYPSCLRSSALPYSEGTRNITTSPTPRQAVTSGLKYSSSPRVTKNITALSTVSSSGWM